MPHHGEAEGVGLVAAYSRLIDSIFHPLTANLSFHDFAYLNPVQIPFDLTVDRIGWANAGVSAGNVRAGLYRDNGDTPVGGALVFETGAVAMGLVSQKQDVIIPDTVLTRGLYWFIFQNDNDTARFIYIHSPLSIGGFLQSYRYDHAFAPFTDPCPASVVRMRPPWMYLRVASIP